LFCIPILRYGWDNNVMTSARPVQFDAILPAPFGALGVRLAGEALAGLVFLPPESALRPGDSDAIRNVGDELEAYYANPAHEWKLTLAPVGSVFRQQVWQLLMTIPSGETRTYGELSARLHSSPRAVGQAVGDNPIPIVIPCHRVLAAHGLGGFMHGTAGFPLEVKKWLLRHEGQL
jgi:methylated-DNA-[protein]-cysteine S-methyltransferase